MCWDNQLRPEGHYLVKCSSWGGEEEISISQMTLKSLAEYAPFYHLNFGQVHTLSGLPQRLRGKESACSAGNTGDVGSIPGSGKSPGKGNGYPLQYSCLRNPISAWAHSQALNAHQASLWQSDISIELWIWDLRKLSKTPLLIPKWHTWTNFKVVPQ